MPQEITQLQENYIISLKLTTTILNENEPSKYYIGVLKAQF